MYNPFAKLLTDNVLDVMPVPILSTKTMRPLKSTILTLDTEGVFSASVNVISLVAKVGWMFKATVLMSATAEVANKSDHFRAIFSAPKVPKVVPVAMLPLFKYTTKRLILASSPLFEKAIGWQVRWQLLSD